MKLMTLRVMNPNPKSHFIDQIGEEKWKKGVENRGFEVSPIVYLLNG